jgi:hypothetical protein
MKHRASPRFWRCYHSLPRAVQELADENYRLLCNDPRHPSLRLKKVGQLWSVRVGSGYRALAVEDSGELLWAWIGPHDEYDELLKRM